MIILTYPSAQVEASSTILFRTQMSWPHQKLTQLNLCVMLQGVLHTDLLSMNLRDKAEMMLTNALQIIEQFMVSSYVFSFLYLLFQVL